MSNSQVFRGCMPALMTPCFPDRSVNYDALVHKGKELIEAGMRAVVYCGSMGDWPLLSDAQRQQGVRRLVEAGVPVVVGTGCRELTNSGRACRPCPRGGCGGVDGHSSRTVARLLVVGSACPLLRNPQGGRRSPRRDLQQSLLRISNKGDLFAQLRHGHRNLVGFKEFGGAESLSYAAEFITSDDPDLALMVGVDTQVYHGFVRCGAIGAITGIGNALPRQVLRLVGLCDDAAAGDAEARRLAQELDANAAGTIHVR